MDGGREGKRQGGMDRWVDGWRIEKVKVKIKK